MSDLLSSLVSFVVVLGILVVVHEWGHYAVARWCGVHVIRFAIGFGKPLWRRTGRHGTEWVVAAIPLGGYVRMLDERDPEFPVLPNRRHEAFNTQSPWRKMAIVLAGPAANFLLAIILFTGLFSYGVQEAVPILSQPRAGTLAEKAGFRDRDTVLAVNNEAVQGFGEFRWRMIDALLARGTVDVQVQSGHGLLSVRRMDLSGVSLERLDRDIMGELGLEIKPEYVGVRMVEPDTPAASAGIQANDRIQAVNGMAIATVRQLIDLIRESPDQSLSFVISRDGRPLTLTVKPLIVQNENGPAVGRIGAGLFAQASLTVVNQNPLDALARAWSRTYDTTLVSLRMFGRMITGEASWKNLSGPVSIAEYAGTSARMGLESFVGFLALVSISLGVLNLMPVPILDGGQFLYHAAELVRGRPVSIKTLELGQRVGIALIAVLTGVALFNDLARLLG